MLTFTVSRHIKLIFYVVILLRANIFLPTGLRHGGPRLVFFCTQFCPLCDKHVIAMCPRAIKD